MSNRLEEIENSRVFCNQLPPLPHQQRLLPSSSSHVLLEAKNEKSYGGGTRNNKTIAVGKEIYQEEQQGKKEHRRQHHRYAKDILDNKNDETYSSSSSVVPPSSSPGAAARLIRMEQQKNNSKTTMQMQHQISSSTKKRVTSTLKGEHDGRDFLPAYSNSSRKTKTSALLAPTNSTSDHPRHHHESVLSQATDAGHHHDGIDGRDEEECYHTMGNKNADSIDSRVTSNGGSSVPFQQQELNSSTTTRKYTINSRPPFLPEKSFSSSPMKKQQNKSGLRNSEPKLLRVPQADDDASSFRTRDNSITKHYMTSTFSSFGSSSQSLCSSTKSFTTYNSLYSSSNGRFQGGADEERVAHDEEQNDTSRFHSTRDIRASNTNDKRKSLPSGVFIVPGNHDTLTSTNDNFFASKYACALQDVIVKNNSYNRSNDAKDQHNLLNNDFGSRRGRAGEQKCNPTIHDRLARTKTKSMDLRLQMEMAAKKEKERERQGSRGRPAFYVVANSSSFSTCNSNTPTKQQKPPSVRTRSASPRKHFYTYLTETETISSSYRKGLATPQKPLSSSTTGQKLPPRAMEALCTRLANQDTVASSKRIVPTPNRKPIMANIEAIRQADELEKKRHLKGRARKDFFDILAVEKTKSMLLREVDTLKSGSFKE
jgi:hypothetical protein